MTLTPAPDHELEARRRVAAAVTQTLSTAGLPAHIANGNSPRLSGAEVEVDQFEEDEGGGVFASWNSSRALVDEIAARLLAKDCEHPAIRLNGVIGEAMAAAMFRILETSGFRVEVADDEYRPCSLQVHSS